MAQESRTDGHTLPVHRTHWGAAACVVLLVVAMSVMGLRAGHANDFEANEVFKGCGTVVLDELYYCYLFETGKEGHRFAVPGIEEFYPGDELYIEGKINWGTPSFCTISGDIEPDVITLCASDCTADLNDDGVVDVFDLLILIESWGPCGYDCPPADLNDDGIVDVLDLLILIGDWGVCS